MFNRMLRGITLALTLVLLLSGWPGTGKVSAAEQENQVLVNEWMWSTPFKKLDSYRIKSISPTSDGGYLVAGAIIENSVNSRGWVAKLTSSGKLEWEKLLKYEEEIGISCYPVNMFETRDGKYLVVGKSYADPDMIPRRPFSRMYLTKLNTDGSILWSKGYNFEGKYNGLEDGVESEDGGYLIIGNDVPMISGQRSVPYLLKTDQDGNVIWNKSNDIGGHSFKDLISTSDGGALAVGSTDVLGSVTDEALVVKYSANGEIDWTYKAGAGLTNPFAASVIPAAEGDGYLINGYGYQNDGTSTTDVRQDFIMKVSNSGELIWEKNLPSDRNFRADRFVTAPTGNFLIGSYTDGEFTKAAMIKIDESTGEIVGRIVHDKGTPSKINLLSPAQDGGVFAITTMIEKGPLKSIYRDYLIKYRNDELFRTGIRFAVGGQVQLQIGESRKSVIQAVYSIGTNETIDPSRIRFTSADSSIATVDEKGNITGIDVGATEITASYDGLEAVLKVAVEADDWEHSVEQGPFYLDSKQYSLTLGDQFELEAKFRDEQGQVHLVNKDTVFTISDSRIATIDEFGSIKGIAPGTTYVTAQYQGHTYRASIRIYRSYYDQVWE